jgi:HAD superfamily hydrolase (TIGR01509 family)
VAGGRFGLIIFDNDGVLVDSEPLANAVLAELLNEYGLPMTVDQCVAEFMGCTLASVGAQVSARLGRPLPPDFEARYHEGLFGRYETGLVAVPGVVAALERINRLTVTCVASSGSRERIQLSLTLTGLIDYFDGRLFSADEVVHGKPAPDLFRLAARSLGVAPDACAVIEDSPLGIEAAAAAGMTSFGYAGRTPPERLAGASVVFSDMADLPALLGYCF